LDEHTRRTLARGRAVREALKQPLYDPLPATEQIAILRAAPAGIFDDMPGDKVAAASGKIRETLPRTMPHLYELVEKGENLGDADSEALIGLARKAVGA
jgi:F-type H+-transporting ATPase subunit alpha